MQAVPDDEVRCSSNRAAYQPHARVKCHANARNKQTSYRHLGHCTVTYATAAIKDATPAAKDPAVAANKDQFFTVQFFNHCKYTKKTEFYRHVGSFTAANWVLSSFMLLRVLLEKHS